MVATIQRNFARAALLLGAFALASALQQQQQQQPETQRPTEVRQENMGPAYEQVTTEKPQDKGGIMPMVDVDRQNNKSTVDVHVPIFFDMTSHKENDTGRSRLDLSVLHGLVTVNKDRVPDANGQMTGPMKVTVFGIPVYQGKASPNSASELDNSIARSRSSLNQQAQGASHAASATGEKLVNGLTDFLGRIQSMVRQATSAIGSSQSGDPHQPEREARQQQQQPGPYDQRQNQIERSPVRSARDESPVRAQS